MRRAFFVCLLVSSAILLSDLLLAPVSAGDHFFSNRQRSRTNCFLKHDYSDSRWPFTEQRYFRKTVIAVAATDPTKAGNVRKPFHFRATALTVDHVTLDQVGLALIKADGTLYATGRITHSGGDGGLIGNNLIIRIRAYVSPAGLTTISSGATGRTVNAAGIVVEDENDVIPLATPNEVTRIPPDAYRVWETEHKFWVSRGGPHHVKLAPNADRMEDRVTLQDHFDDITHLEVELAYQRDR
jgi:hypothetical protein